MKFWVFFLAALMTLASTVTLLCSVLKIRCMSSKLRSRDIFEKEKVVVIHSVLVSCWFLAFIVTLIDFSV